MFAIFESFEKIIDLQNEIIRRLSGLLLQHIAADELDALMESEDFKELNELKAKLKIE